MFTRFHEYIHEVFTYRRKKVGKGGENEENIVKNEPFNFDKLCGIAIQQLGLNIQEFYSLTPVELHHALISYAKQEQYRQEGFMRTAWEVLRVQLVHLYGMNPHIKRRPKKVEQIFKLPWDKKQEPRKQSTEEMKKILTIIHAESKRMKKRTKK